MTLTLWAPKAKQTWFHTRGERLPMVPAEHGWWTIEVSERQGLRYRFSVDDGPPRPDPRSRWQPEGVHGESEWVEVRPAGPAGFRPRPLAEAILYEIHVGTFTPEGTYRAAIGKLGHVVELGVTHIELMPLATFPGTQGWGYDGVYLYAPHPAYGTPQDLADFVGACHEHGLGVILDVVYNHLGPDGNYAPYFGPYFTSKWKTMWGDAMNFDGPSSDGVRSFVIDNACMWLRDYGFDGLRLDAVHAIFDTRAMHILEALATEVARLGRDLGREFVVIAESDFNDPRIVRPVRSGGLGLDAHWQDDFHHAVHAYLTGERAGCFADFSGLKDIARALRDGYVYQGQYSPARACCHGRPPVGVEPHQLVICIQNHDQIGNRAFGERISHLVDLPGAMAAAALLLLAPWTPLLFQGEEWAASSPFLYFVNHQDPDLAKAVAEGRRNDFGHFGWKDEVPDPNAPDTFERSRLNWAEISRPEHTAMLDWYRALIRIRREAEGRAEVEFDESQRWLRFRRGRVLAQFNFAAEPQAVPAPEGVWKTVATSRPDGGQLIPAGGTCIRVRP